MVKKSIVKKSVAKKENENMRIAFLLVSLITAIYLLAWPIYFFGFSTIKIIEMDFSSLVYFAFFETALIVFLVLLWYVHRKIFG